MRVAQYEPAPKDLSKARLFNTNYKGTTTVRHQYMIGLELRPRPKTRDPSDKVFSLVYEPDSQFS